MQLKVPTASYYSGCTFFRDLEIPIKVIHVEENKAYPDHYHEFDELVLICSGSVNHIIGGSSHHVRRGDVFFIRSGVHHQYSEPEGLRYINIIFDEKALLDETVAMIIDSIPESGINLGIIDENTVKSIVGRIDKELYEKKTAYTQMARTYLMQLICLIHRSWKDDYPPSELSIRDRIKRVIRFLEDENGPQVSVKHLAEEAGTCTRNFHRIFRELTGTSPHDFLNRLRIERACELLGATEISITSISEMVNYSDSNYFTRQFRKITGQSPTRYRRSDL